MAASKEHDENKPKRAPNGTYLPGVCPNPSGRPKGSKNIATMTLKAAIMESFWQLGGPGYLVKLAQANPEVYARLLLQILPRAMPEGGDDAGDADIFIDPDPDL